MNQLQDRIHAEIVLGCDTDGCKSTFIASEMPSEPAQAWSSRATAEAEILGWSASSQNQILCPLCSKLREPLASRISSAAQALLDGRSPFLDSIGLLSGLRFEVAADGHDPDFLVFLAIDSETDHLPSTNAKEHCAPEWLIKCEAEEKQVSIVYACQIEEACHRLMRRFCA